MIPPSGEQHELRLGEQSATVVEVGGGVRTYDVGGRPVLEPYRVEDICDGGHGAVLIPWPNRLGDGRYRFDGHGYQLPLTEPEKHNAIHGLLRWRSWQAERVDAEHLIMSTRLHPESGYPFLLDVEVAYRLGGDGLTVTTTATNKGEAPCPYGCGQHPYLSPGTGLIDEAVLCFRADERILTDAERQLPTGTEAVAGTAYDFSSPRRIGGLEIDFAFTGLTRDDAGRATVSLTGADGLTVELWADGSYPILELFTGDTLAAGRRRTGLGVEPMSCPPDAFRSGDRLIRLEPGEADVHRWGVRLVPG